MVNNIIRIATRQSPLALWQAYYVQQLLTATHPNLQVELCPMVTQGDMVLGTSWVKNNGKGLFVKELEQALLEQRADIAVHSMKDVPVILARGLGITAICERGDPRDALVSHHLFSIETLPHGSIIGTSSLRRQCQLRERRPDFIVRDLRGNVGTRLAKLDNGDYDAVILAVAGLKRLGVNKRLYYPLSVEECLPAIGQGAVGIECRLNDHTTRRLLMPLNHTATEARVCAERAVNTRLEAGCHVSIGSYAELNGDNLWLRALVGSSDGNQIVRAECRGPTINAKQIGIELAEKLLARGALKILHAMY